MSVHIVQNPIKVIKIKGNLNDKTTWSKKFPTQNGNIFNGFWLIGLKSFASNVKAILPNKVVNVSCNVVTGFEQEVGEPAKHCNPPISQVCLNTINNTEIKVFDLPSFFLINKVDDTLVLDFSFFPSVPETRDIAFEAVFHYYCQGH